MPPIRHRDPRVVAEGREPAHGLPLSPDARSLDGSWSFRFWRGVPPDDDWIVAGPPTDDTVQVPGSWQLQGDEWGIPIYTNVQYPFDPSDYPAVPLEDEGGDHHRTVDVPADWRDRRVVLRIGAAESVVEVWVNGRPVGLSTDSRLPAEFDVTGAVTPGEPASIALRVHRWSAATWIEDQDMWWLSGLHRSVHLYATPRTRIADAHVRTRSVGPTSEVSVEVDVVDADGATVEATVADTSGASVVADGRAVIPLSLVDVDLWTAETPALHDATIVLRAADGAELDHHHLRVGVRTVETDGGRLLVNGVPVTLRGVNRHEHDGETGRWQSDELLRSDLELIRASNINAIRTAHYPNDERFYDLCDEIGLYVMDEANIESHGMVHRLLQPCNDDRFADAFVARGERMVRRDRNHPCVIAWSLGNESGFGPNHRRMAEAMRAADPDRPLAYHPAEVDPIIDIIGPMYPTVGELARLCALPDDRPVVMCEYSHAMGNSNGGMESYWGLIEGDERAWGGFIWDWVDQGLARTTADGTRWWAYGGDFGDQPNDRNFNCNGLVDADRRPHPALRHVAWVYRPVLTELLHVDGDSVRLRIENRRSFADTADLTLRWTLRRDGRDHASGTVDGVVVAPRSTAELELAVGERGGGEWRLLVEWVADSAAVSWDDLALPEGRPPLPPWTAPTSTRAATGSSGDDGGATLTGSHASVELDGLAVPTAIRLGSLDLAPSWGRWGLWRAPTDNDAATFGDERLVHRLERAGLARAEARPFGPADVRTWDGTHGEGIAEAVGSASARWRLTFAERVTASVTWVVGPDGDVALDLTLLADLDVPPLLRAGLELELPGHLDRVVWHGPGPEESYSDRRHGLPVAIHDGPVADQWFPYARPQESGNHTQCRWFALTDADGAGVVAIGDEWFDAQAIPARSEDLEAARHPHEVTWRDATVLRLDAAHSGLGTGSCGPGIEPAHQVHPYHVRKRIVLRGLEAGDDPAEVAARPTGIPRPRRWHY